MNKKFILIAEHTYSIIVATNIGREETIKEVNKKYNHKLKKNDYWIIPNNKKEPSFQPHLSAEYPNCMIYYFWNQKSLKEETK